MAKKILLVDDEIGLREVLREFLEWEKYKVAEASNGNEAWEMILKQDFDLVLSDIRMPGGTGIELAEKIFNYDGKKPFVYLMTGYSDLTVPEATKVGVIKVMNKPFEPKELIKDIISIIGK